MARITIPLEESPLPEKELDPEEKTKIQFTVTKHFSVSVKALKEYIAFDENGILANQNIEDIEAVIKDFQFHDDESIADFFRMVADRFGQTEVAEILQCLREDHEDYSVKPLYQAELIKDYSP